MGKKEIPPAVFSARDYQELINNLKVGVYRSTPGPKGKFLFVNPTLVSILGYNSKDLKEICVKDIYENPAQRLFFCDKIGRQGYVKNEELRLKKKNGTPIWCSVTAFAVKSPKGKVQWFDGIIEDISARRRVERELLESKEIFRVVFDNSAVAITVTDREEKIIAWNPFAEKILEMGKEVLFNKHVKELYPHSEWTRIRRLHLRKKGIISNVETKIVRSDGTLLDIDLSISILKDIEGNITGAIGIMRDITNQKLIEKQLKDSENKIRTIIDNTAAAITMTDENERILSWNKFAEQLLGMDSKDLYMKPVNSLYPEEEWRRIRAENIRKIGSKHHLETRIIRKDGQVIDIDISINVLKDAGNNIIGSVGIMQDITERKKAQAALLQAKIAAEEASNAKTMFLANMSHEVRTPMNAVICMIDLTLDTRLDEEQKENLKTAKDAAGNLLNLLNDILDLSRVEAGKLKLEKIEFDLPDVIKSVCKGLSVLARNKNLDLAWGIDAKAPTCVMGDPTRLRQIVINLVNNAIKFTPKGTIEVKVEALYISEDGCELKFSVSDTGIGIPKDKFEAIFEAFTQADDSVTRKYGGTGLGLTISKKLVQMMGGDIWVESEVGVGTTFYFTAKFPVAKKEGETAQIAAEKSAVIAPRPAVDAALKILLAEDNIVNQKIAVKILEKKGWNVDAVQNGQEVIDLIGKKPFDLVLMDVQMPVIDGLKATQIIREQERQSGKHIPIVAMTAHAMDGDEKRCLAAGMDGYVAKPIDREKLFQTIENIVKKG